MKIWVSAKTFQKIVAITKGITIGIVVVVICLFIYEELVGPAIAYILEKSNYNYNESDVEESDSISFSESLTNGSIKLIETDDFIDIFEISKFGLTKLIENEQGEVLYIKDGVQKKVTYNGQLAYRLQFSPTQDKFGFYYYPDGDTLKDMVLVIMDISERTVKEIYRKSIQTSGWEWFSNDGVLVDHGCGTECQVLYLINIKSGKKYTLQYGVDYQWSPNKQMVLAYHYSGRPGITIGDKFGNVLFDFLRERSQIYSKLMDQTKAWWSPDNTKIALLIKKESEDIMEMIVFNVKQNFKLIFQDDLAGEGKDIELVWLGMGKSLVYRDLRSEREVVF